MFGNLAHSGATVNQLLRRAAAAAALRRERNNSSQSEELSLKRQRSDNGNNNSPDVISHMPQVTAADFSTIKHNNNNTPPMKDAERAEDYSSDRECRRFYATDAISSRHLLNSLFILLFRPEQYEQQQCSKWQWTIHIIH